jgi:MFS family permease
VGIFAAIYHPVGLAMIVEGREKTGVPLAINGVFGNMGVASAALITGILIDNLGWRSAFVLPGLVSIILGVVYMLFEMQADTAAAAVYASDGRESQPPKLKKNTLYRIFIIILITTALGGLVFQSTTFALPKVLDERLPDFAGTATLVGFYAFLVFSIAAFAQLVVGYLLDRHPVRTVLAWVAILQAVLFTLMIPLNGIAALLTAIGFMLVVFGEIPIIDVLVGRIAHSEWRSRAYALVYLVSFGVSASAVPMIAVIHGAWGFELLFAILAVFSLAIFIAALSLPNEKYAESKQY